MPNTDNQPLDLDAIETRANAATDGPWSSHEDWPGRVFSDGNPNYLHIARTTGFNAEANERFIAHARTDVPALVAEVRRLTDRVAELEAYAYGCDAEGCTLPHSSWCEAAKKTAAANNGCTCGQPWTGHPQPHAMHCWTVNPPRAEVEEMRKKVAEVIAGRDAAAIELREAARKAIAKAEAERDAARTKTLATEADEIVAHCPDHGSRDSVWMDCHCAVADDMRRRAALSVTPA